MNSEDKDIDLTEKLIFGCEQLGGVDWGTYDWKNVSRAINYAWERGIRKYDTAGSYGLGLSEQRLGQALGQYRKDAQICSKGGIKWKKNEGQRAQVFVDNSVSSLKEDLFASLKRIGIDRLHTFLVHRVSGIQEAENSITFLEDCKDSGLIETYGLSNFIRIDELVSLRRGVGSVAQFSFSLLDIDQTSAALNYYASVGVHSMVYGPLAQGLLSGKYISSQISDTSDRRSRLSHFKPSFIASLKPVFDSLSRQCDITGFTMAQVALATLLLDSRVSSVVIGCKNEAQVEEALAVAQDSKKRDLIQLDEIWKSVEKWKNTGKKTPSGNQ